MKIHDLCSYQIEISDQIDEKTFNATSPLQIKIIETGQTTTLFMVSADQSGLVGLVRRLHQQGFVLLSVRRAVEGT